MADLLNCSCLCGNDNDSDDHLDSSDIERQTLLPVEDSLNAITNPTAGTISDESAFGLLFSLRSSTETTVLGLATVLNEHSNSRALNQATPSSVAVSTLIVVELLYACAGFAILCATEKASTSNQQNNSLVERNNHRNTLDINRLVRQLTLWVSLLAAVILSIGIAFDEIDELGSWGVGLTTVSLFFSKALGDRHTKSQSEESDAPNSPSNGHAA